MKKLTKDHFSFKCPMSWDDMSPSDHGRFCGKCSKEVYDLTHCSLDEVREIQSRQGSICGMIRVATVAASLSMVACNEKSDQQAGELAPPTEQGGEELMGKPVIAPPTTGSVSPIPVSENPSVEEPPMLLGDIVTIPEVSNQPEMIRGKIAPVPQEPENQGE